MTNFPLKENGDSIPVTEENKAEYVKLYVDYRLFNAVEPQLKAFFQGMFNLGALWMTYFLVIVFVLPYFKGIGGGSKVKFWKFLCFNTPKNLDYVWQESFYRIEKSRTDMTSRKRDVNVVFGHLHV